MTGRKTSQRHGRPSEGQRTWTRSIHADMKPEVADKLLNQEVDYDVTGCAQHYCLHCAWALYLLSVSWFMIFHTQGLFFCLAGDILLTWGPWKSTLKLKCTKKGKSLPGAPAGCCLRVCRFDYAILFNEALFWSNVQTWQIFKGQGQMWNGQGEQ